MISLEAWQYSKMSSTDEALLASYSKIDIELYEKGWQLINEVTDTTIMSFI